MKSEKFKYKSSTLHSSLYTFHFNLPCFILVGGRSSRFGSEKDDKALLFYRQQYDKCRQIFKNVYFVAKYKKFKNYPFFIEKSKIYAPLPALEEIVKKHKKIFILSVDTPNITPQSIIKLLHKKAVASDNPLIGYYDYTMLAKIRKNLKGKMRIFDINSNKIKIKEKEVLNINTLNDLKKL
ncbi:molybdopterin-guanine dinucleotide biosynthesis protein A [Nautilia profundicola AmH]|uniref:Molybdopterin-guanine dinucleotide biosynthesis protein A n=1 Tax=Nautilia profundicola (strain ATCC BAA-1463 / DSM 18972 / AmH) TaxID=598659 RepID=B9L839_NAUPA|nr:NTP transferase domain-containing protein [Nautilia profundicola]ACM92809.1 molybdopterin-guanine dinucleotide biosynthesis protein A [Nautilia profundicola AmH]